MKTRTPDENHPFAPALDPRDRKTRPTYADPTGGRATGRARKEDPEGLIAKARAARREALEKKQ